MKSEQSANPADDEEIIELTDILKPGPDAEQAIVELTDVVETVKAEPHEPSAAFDEDQPLDLGENAVVEADSTETLVDLTDALDPPEMEPSDKVTDSADDLSDEGQALLDLDDVVDDGADDELDLDLTDALDASDDEDQDAILELDDSLVLDDAVEEDSAGGEAPEATPPDAGEIAAELGEEIQVDPQVLDLAEVLDAANEDSLVLDTPAGDTEMADEETLEVIEADPVEDPLAGADTPLVDDESASFDLDDVVDTVENQDDAFGAEDESENILDLDEPIGSPAAEAPAEPPGDQAADGLFEAADTGDDLDFKLDEMLAEAQAEMPATDDDDADLELDLSEALADVAADSTEEDSDEILGLGDPLAPTSHELNDGDETADDGDDFDLISEDKVIELDDPVAPEAAATHDNVIELADVTGGYPTISPSNEFESEASDSEDLPAESESLLEDVFQDEENGDSSLVVAEPVDEELGLGITLDDDEIAEDEDKDFQLNPEMEKLEATLEDVLQDTEGDPLIQDVLADGAAEADIDADMAAMSLTDAEAAPVAAKTAIGELPAEITEADLDAAVMRVIKTMYADRIEQMILDVIKEAVTAEIDKVKRSLGDKA